MKKIGLLVIGLLFAGFSFAQEENIDNLRPPTLLGKKAPEYPVKQWINRPLQTDILTLKLLYFWSASNPQAAYIDIPRFNKFAKEFEGKLEIIGLSSDAPEDIVGIEPALCFPYAHAPEAVTNFGIKIPGYCFILAPDGTVLYEGFPLLEGEIVSEKLLNKLIRKHYKKK